MAALVEFARRILTDGEVILRDPPAAAGPDRAATAALLADAYDAYRLDVAGPPLPFDARAALAAAECLWSACWFLVDRRDAPDEVARRLPDPGVPDTASAHLSADILLRHLPSVHRRAKAPGAPDVLATWAAGVLRRWPLSGVLADLDDGPLTDLDFGGHAGLRLLYAERLASRPRSAWTPRAAARGHVELVFAERGVLITVLTTETQRHREEEK